jgi:hypothetical protein
MSSQLISRNDLKIAIESNLTKVIEIYLTSRGDNKKKQWIWQASNRRAPCLSSRQVGIAHAIYLMHVSALRSCLCIMKQGTDQDWQCGIARHIGFAHSSRCKAELGHRPRLDVAAGSSSQHKRKRNIGMSLL